MQVWANSVSHFPRVHSTSVPGAKSFRRRCWAANRTLPDSFIEAAVWSSEPSVIHSRGVTGKTVAWIGEVGQIAVIFVANGILAV